MLIADKVTSTKGPAEKVARAAKNAASSSEL